MKSANTKKNFPSGTHYAIVTFDSITQDGGHGYGVYSTPCVSYEYTESKEEWEAEVKKLALGMSRDWVAIVVQGQAHITTEVKIEESKDK